MTTALVPFLIVGAGMTWLLTYRNSQAAIRELADQLGGLSMKDIRENLERYLAAPTLVNAINEYSFSGTLEKAPSSEVLAGRFGAELARFGTVISIAYSNEKGEYVGMARDVAGVPFSLGIADSSTMGYLAAYRSSVEGTRGAEFERSPSPYDARLRPWYSQAVAAGGPTWTPVYLWLSGDAGLDFVTPVRDQRGTFRGVMDTSLTLAGMGGFLSSIRATAHSAAFIVERSGMLVAASGIDTPYRSSGESLQRLAAASSSDPLIRAGGARLMTALQDGESFDAERQFAFRIGHARHLMRAARFRGGPGLDWYFAEVIPESDFAGPIYADMRSTAVFVALLLAASLAVTLALARRISAPLKLLTGMVRGMESGDLSVEFPVTGTREVSQLSDSFNAMAARLRRSFGSLAESEARYRAIFHRSAVSLIEADVSELHAALEGLATRGITDVERYLRENRDFLIDALRSIRIIDANETAVELLGAGSRDELLGPLDVRFDEQALSALLPAAVANAVKGRQQGLETSLTTRTGASIDVILNLYVPAEDDVLANMLISVVDITARTRAERERAALQEQLRQVQKVETIGRLAGGIAHDINNLLTPILAGAELLGLPGVDQEETAQQILGAANRVRELTRKLLAFSRKQELHREVVRLGTVVDDFQALLRRLVRREIDLRVLVRDEVDPVRVDVGQVEQVLMNLALNAQDAMPSGGTLTIDVHNVDLDEELARSRGAEPGRYVALAVTDTGFGMEAATLQHLFEPFYTTKQPGKGTGLGLSTVYGIVRQHGGHILVDSGPDRGTRFQIFFPRHDGE